ncbi:hypothetical protein BJQ90_02798 [Arthrobacter sp. SO3]|nr:hypothetical protein [Arthrobacter sp. SO3]
MMAEPCEYRCGGSGFSPVVNAGVKIRASPRLRPTCSAMIHPTGVPASSRENWNRATTSRDAPVTVSGSGPTLSKSRPMNGPSRPIARPPGSSVSPVSSDVSPRISCRYNGRRITAPNRAIMATTSSSTDTVNIREVNARRSSRGASDFCSRNCRSTNATMAMTPTANAMTAGAPGPPWPPIWLSP